MMKSTLNFDRMPSLSENAIKSFTLIALINYSISMLIKQDAENANQNKKFASIQKAVKAYRQLASPLMEYLMLARKFSKKRINSLQEKIIDIAKYLFDPNYKKRRSTKEAILQG